ncbi:MAG: aminotransferase class V-fold PLP-dependent enzyme, partial [Clostridia bacterium]|nr:aminotransferase class V-fold PLP-dependent enzyme [Clostridia bacterium]
LNAEHVLSDARSIILNALGISRGVRGELVFVSGGTEANNIAVLGSVFAKARQNNEKILTTDSEHASVSAPLEYLEKKGFKIIRVPTKQGELDLDFIKNNAQGSILATFMHVNNETGALYNLPEAFKIVKELSPNCVTHADCVQSFMKVKFTKKSLGADLISISAHKINGAKGVGALYIAPEIIKQKKVVPLFMGGGQEENFRSGTENVYGIASFGEATKEHFANIDTEIDKMSSVREYLVENLKNVDGVSLNLPKNNAPHILNMSVVGIRSEITLHDLSSKGVYVSSGSACSSNAPKKTHSPLTAFGLDTKMADSAIRVSLCPNNTIEEAEYFIDCLKDTIGKRAKR